MRIAYLVGPLLWAVGTTYGEYRRTFTRPHRVPVVRVRPRIDEWTETLHVNDCVLLEQGYHCVCAAASRRSCRNRSTRYVYSICCNPTMVSMFANTCRMKHVCCQRAYATHTSKRTGTVASLEIFVRLHCASLIWARVTRLPSHVVATGLNPCLTDDVCTSGADEL